MVNPRKIAPDIWRLPFLDQTPTTAKICQWWSRLLTNINCVSQKIRMWTETKFFETQLAAQLGPADPQTQLACRQENPADLFGMYFWLSRCWSNSVWLMYIVTSGWSLSWATASCFICRLVWLVWLVWLVRKKRRQLPESCGHTSIQPDFLM